jgi:ribosome maturation factor RimP
MPPANAGGSAAVARAHLLELLGPVVAAAGYDIEDITVISAGRRSLVRVSVDADGGIDLDGVAAVSRLLSDALDRDAGPDAAFAGPYVLEVGSPGVERPLTEPRHWRRAMGRLVQVPVDGQPVTGRVCSTADGGVTLDVEGSRREVPWDRLGRGRVQVEFNRAAADPAAGTSADEIQED